MYMYNFKTNQVDAAYYLKPGRRPLRAWTASTGEAGAERLEAAARPCRECAQTTATCGSPTCSAHYL